VFAHCVACRLKRGNVSELAGRTCVKNTARKDNEAVPAYRPAGPSSNRRCHGSSLHFLAVFWLLSLAHIAAQDQENTPPGSNVTSAQQFQHYLDRTFGWQTLSWLATDAASDHFASRPEWGRGPGGFGCDYGSLFGERLINTTTELGVSLVLREDMRYHPSQRKGFLPRVRYAVAHAFLDSGPGGRYEPAYARFAGIATSALIAPAWHQRSLSVPDFFEDFTFGALGQMQNSLLSEFSPDLRRLGRTMRQKVLRK
jgi:hypothetical protein